MARSYRRRTAVRCPCPSMPEERRKPSKGAGGTVRGGTEGDADACGAALSCMLEPQAAAARWKDAERGRFADERERKTFSRRNHRLLMNREGKVLCRWCRVAPGGNRWREDPFKWTPRPLFIQGNEVWPSLEKRGDSETKWQAYVDQVTQRTSGVGGAEALCAVPCFAASGAAARGAALRSGARNEPSFKCSEGRLPSCSRCYRLMKPRGGVWRGRAGKKPLCAFCDDGRC